MWKWNYSTDFKKKFIDYHLASINAPEYTSTQVYQDTKRKIKSNHEYQCMDIDYPINTTDRFINVLYNRKTSEREFLNQRTINKEFISQFSQLAFIGGDRDGRTYPSGGAQYYVNIHYLFNENKVTDELLAHGNICEVNCDTHQLMAKSTIPWSSIEQSFIQQYLVNTAQFSIVLSVDLHDISKKYTDISYKLVQQEAGHIGQNIQLVATYLGIQSVPLGGFYDVELSNLIGENQSVIYAFLLG